MYGTLKFSYIISKSKPGIGSYIKEDEMAGVPMNLNERNYRVAFSVESFLGEKKQQNDPRYVKYMFRMVGQRDGEEYQRMLDYHTCTDEDYD